MKMNLYVDLTKMGEWILNEKTRFQRFDLEREILDFLSKVYVFVEDPEDATRVWKNIVDKYEEVNEKKIEYAKGPEMIRNMFAQGWLCYRAR